MPSSITHHLLPVGRPLFVSVGFSDLYALVVQFRMLGHLEVVSGDRCLPIGGPKQRALLAALLLNPNRFVSASRLIEAIWGDDPPPSAAHALEVYASKIRRSLGEADRLVHEQGAYRLRVEEGERDLDQFEQVILEGRSALASRTTVAARAAFGRALELWRGDVLDDLTDLPFTRVDADRLAELRLEAFEERIEADLALGRHAEVVGELESLVSLYPLRERLWAQLMLALYRSGRQAEALRTYQQVRRVLGEELGIEPGAELQQLEEEILLHAPRLQFITPRRHNLPAASSSFVGRKKEVAESVRLLDSTRLLTLTGPGGTGKTRLALQVAEEMLEAFPQEVFFVPLAPLSDPDLVPSAITTALGLTQASGPPLEHLCQYLADREMLLILDNFEHILGAAPSVAELLRTAPRLKVLVTSRAPLRVTGEWELEVPPLKLPDLAASTSPEALAASEAVVLFVERASAGRADFHLTAQNAQVVAEITTRLDGLPLAIELAAARIKLLTPQAIAHHLGDRLGFLVGGPRDLPGRQQTLRDTIEWSYELLDLPAQRLLARLAVFRGGEAIDQVEAVCTPREKSGADLLKGLDMLVNQSLLRQEQSDGEPRFAMLETIRQFAWERLAESGETAEIERRHAYAYLGLAEEAASRLLTWDQALWLNWLERDHDNLRAAISWVSQNGETDMAFRLATALWRFWQIRGHLVEGADHLVRALDLPGGDPRNRALTLEAAGGVAYWRGEMREAADFYHQSLRLMEKLDDRASVANALYNLAFPYFFGEDPDYEEATRLLSESLTISRELEDEAGMVKGLYGLGSVAWTAQDWRQAQQLFEECLRIVRKRDDPFHRGWILFMLGSAEVRAERSDLARPLLREGLKTFAKIRDMTGILFHLHYFTALAIEDGQFERAVRLVGAAAQLQETSGAKLVEKLSHDLPGLQDTRKRLGTDRVHELLSSGQHMSLEEIVAFAASEHAPTLN